MGIHERSNGRSVIVLKYKGPVIAHTVYATRYSVNFQTNQAASTRGSSVSLASITSLNNMLAVATSLNFTFDGASEDDKTGLLNADWKKTQQKQSIQTNTTTKNPPEGAKVTVALLWLFSKAWRLGSFVKRTVDTLRDGVTALYRT